LLRRGVAAVGVRFADYVAVDGEFAKAPFLHAVGDLGLKVNPPELFEAARRRLAGRRPDQIFRHGADRVEIWDADDCDP